MKDVQSSPAEVALSIDRVGVKGVSLPLLVRDRAEGKQHTVAQVDLSVDLPAEFKGTHMSRFVEALEEWSSALDYPNFKRLLEDVRERLQARRAHVLFRFPYFLRQTSPASGSRGWMSFDCSLEGDLREQGLAITLGVEVPVMTVCPCSLAICDGGAHSQRSLVRIKTRFSGLVWIEELVAIGQAAGSSPVYTLLKREDEKAVTDNAFANPAFVEDVVRNAAKALEDHPKVTWYRVEVESLESIHNHSAYASIEKDKAKA
jgi:GTP cyclohydrolase I